MVSSMRGGGSERQTLMLLRHLDRKKFAPHLYLTERCGELLQNVPDDVPIHSFEDANATGGFYFPGRVLRRQVSYLRELVARESIDIIYDRTFHMTMIAGKISSVPRVSTIVSPPELALPLVESRFVWLKRRRLAKSYNRSRTVVAVSEQAAKSAQNYYGLNREKLQVIHNPVDIDAVRKAAKMTRVDRNSTLTLACVGRMTIEKGHADLIEALALTEPDWPDDQPPITVWLIGDGPLRVELTKQSKRLLQRHRVEFLGARRDAESLIAAADALVLPSHFEGMPNVVLEAMSVETPVIATRAGGTIELQREEPTILWADPNSPASLAEAIHQFVNDRENAARRVGAATRLVEAHHDAYRTTRRIESLLS